MTVTRNGGKSYRAYASVMVALAISPSLSAAASARDRSSLAGIQACREIDEAKARLACYDTEILKLNAPTFEGRLGLTTEPFHISGPTQLRYQSDGVIFVLYLKDEHGNVLQNLHIGGGGEGTYVIAARGTYALQINGSESWRVWLEPIPENTKTTQTDNKD